MEPLNDSEVCKNELKAIGSPRLASTANQIESAMIIAHLFLTSQIIKTLSPAI